MENRRPKTNANERPRWSLRFHQGDRLNQPRPPGEPPRSSAVDARPRACDVLVVGGGINGAGIARDLAGRGHRVLLCEKDDLAQHTSSSSTKLIHGGLRYLEYYEFGLVR